ncbi:MAG: tetratricopeptide repeat protein [Candidatus Hodarchaeota archaeon]
MSKFNENINLAEKYSKQKKYKKSIKYWEEALKIDPSFSTGWVMMGQAYEKLLQWERSIECYDKALQINPQDSDAKLGRDQLVSKTKNLGPEELRQMKKEELKIRKKEKKMRHKERKIFLIVSCICSLVTGFIILGIYIYLELQADLWFIIPIGFVLGFFVPSIVYVLVKIEENTPCILFFLGLSVLFLFII